MKGCRPFTDKEVSEIYQHGFTGRYTNRNRVLFSLGVVGGFRISELRSITVADVWKHDMVTRYLYIRRRNVKKKSQGRGIKLTERVRDSIRDWIKDMNRYWDNVNGRTMLFTTQESFPHEMSSTTADRILKDATLRIGIADPNGIVGTHSMRKTFANRRYDYYVEEYRKGNITREPILMLQRDLGHSSVDNTLKYISFKSEDIPEHLNRLVE